MVESPSTALARRPLMVVLCLLVGLLAATPGAAAQGPPELDARAWVLLDGVDGERLAGHAASRRLPVASTTKLMTTYLALRELSFDRTVAAPRYDALPVESVVGLSAGERVSVRDLVVAMMLPSANDAAVAVAEAVAGSVPRFVRRMNRAAEQLGLEDTSFANPIGLDHPRNASSARDLAALTLRLREDPRFRRIVAKPRATLKSGSRRRTVESRNTLLGSDPRVDGVKTGHTLGADYVLVGSAERNGVELVSVVLGADSESARDAETRRLLDWGFSQYERRRVARRGEEVGTVSVAGEEELLPVRVARGLAVQARSDQAAEVRIEAREPLRGPITAAERVGRGVLTVDGAPRGAVPVLATRAVAEPSALDEVSFPIAVVLVAGGSMLVVMAFLLAVGRGRAGSRRRPEPGEERASAQRLRNRRQRNRRRQEGNRT
jgi:serine-type D-Ala-D-Ala carboxypeptidase (penicillin-binding protein 5/6)